jgi:hypothetical protein
MGTHTNEASIQIDSSLYKICPSASVGPFSFIYTSGLVRRRDSRPTGANRLDLELGPCGRAMRHERENVPPDARGRGQHE